MTDEKSRKVMRALGGYATPPEALFVGGCVRNTLIDKPVKDMDIATLHQPLQVIEKLKADGIRYVPTGLEHGTVTAIIDDAVFEITTLRKDVETDGRHAVISFTTKWTEDADRRDFTMNTLLASPEGMVFDPTGKGLDDLDKRRVVFVGNASERISEDYLRILRFFRFYAEYGEGPAEAEALKSCADMADKISLLSKERITQEFLKILAVPNAESVVTLMFGNHVLKDMAGGYKPAPFAALCELQVRHDVKDVMARLFTMAGMKADYFERFLVLSNAQKKHLEVLAQGLVLLKSVTKKKIRQLVYRVGNAMALQVYLLKLAQKGALPDLDILDVARYWQAPEFPIKANELIEAGTPQGPALGKKLKALEDKWVAGDFTKIPKY